MLRAAWFADSMPLGLPASQPYRARTARNTVTRFYDNYIQLLELIPDGAGCWKERLTKLEMLEANTNGAS